MGRKWKTGSKRGYGDVPDKCDKEIGGWRDGGGKRGRRLKEVRIEEGNGNGKGWGRGNGI